MGGAFQLPLMTVEHDFDPTAFEPTGFRSRNFLDGLSQHDDGFGLRFGLGSFVVVGSFFVAG